MADSEANAKVHKRKRKQKIHDQPKKPSKLHRLESAQKPQDPVRSSTPWNNLQLILCIQDRQLDLHSKVNQAFNFVSSIVGDGADIDQHCEAVKLPRLLGYLNDWILTVLFPPNGKENWGDGKTPQLDGIDAYMDLSCWEIFKFCLQESLKLRVSLNMSRNLLQTVQFIVKNALSLLEDFSTCSEEDFKSEEKFKLYDIALDCISLVFSSHGGLSNENLDLWVETTGAVLELVLKVYDKNLDGSCVGACVFRFLWLVLQPFSKFLRVHPARKGFQNFVDKLLEPLLHLSGELHLRVNRSDPIWTGRLVKVVEEVISHGLFHPVHIDEFLSLHGSEKYAASCDDKPKDSKATIKSYHRHLFDVLNKIISRKNAIAMGSLGLMFRLFADSARKFRGTSVLHEGSNTMEKINDSRPEESCSSNSISVDTQKSLFNFLVLIMEPLLLEMNAFLQAKINAKLLFSDLYGILKSIGNLLASFMQEKVYVKTEDTSGGACLNFLKKIFNTLIASSTSILCLSNCDTTDVMGMETFFLSANEILVAMGYLLEIEYEVIGEDLVNLWLILLSYSTVNCNMASAFDRSSLSSTIPALGCQIVNLYSQLRQVQIAILALCKALRLMTWDGDAEESSSKLLTFLSNNVYSESVERLLSSHKFIHTIYKAMESIPEGQVSGFVRQITDDISETLRWMKNCSPLADGNKLRMINLHAELLGRGLSRLYSLVLDSATITEGNSNLVGVAVKELMSLLRPYLSILVVQQPDTISKFFSSILGETPDRAVGKDKVLKKFGRSSQWVFVLFLQLFLSSRSLLRQAISLAPPSISKKMSAEMGDYSAYSAFELMERTDETDIGFFSWIAQPSASLLVVMQLISDFYLKYDFNDSSPLVYIFQSMALQRLVDLNRHIVLLKYLQNKLYRSRIKALKEEAAGLTNFIMENISCVYQSPIFVSDDVKSEDLVSLAPQINKWNQGIYVANKNSLPIAIWSNLCKNVDIWGNHGSKKQLKKFFSHLLQTSLHCVSSSFQEPATQDNCKLLKRVTLPHISSDLLSDSVLYELKFAHRNLATIFCSALEKSVLPLFSNTTCTAVELGSVPNWIEFLRGLDNSKEVPVDCSAVKMPAAHSCDKLNADISSRENSSPLTIKSFIDCHHLLNLLTLMSDVNTGSVSHIASCIFNLERLLVNALIYFQSTVYRDYYCEYLRLFVSCRKALRYILMGLSEKTDTTRSTPNSVISESSYPVLWFSKSLTMIVGFQEYVDSSKLEPLKCLTLMAQNLKEQMQNLLASQKGHGLTCENLNRLSSEVSCFSGVLWALTSALGQTNAKDSGYKEKVLMWKSEHVSELKSCIFSFEEVVKFFIDNLLGKNNQLSVNLHDTQNFEKPAFDLSFSGTKYLLSECSVSKANGSAGMQKESKTKATCSTSSATDNVSKSGSEVEIMSTPESVNFVASVLARDDSPEPLSLNKPLLQSLVKGDNPEVAFLLRQLLIAASSLLRLNLQMGDSPLPSGCVPAFIEISQVLLLEFTEMVGVPQQSAFLLLDGALSYLRELASYFPFTDPTSLSKVYTKLVQIHMRAIGKSILLQGKRAKLTLHERQSSTKTLHKGQFEACSSNEMHDFCLNELKTRLRVSFKAFIEGQSELHLLSTIQAIERVLVGVQEGCTIIYGIKTDKDGGEISTLVAAGIDCLDMILEFVSGRKSLKLIKRHCQSLVSAVFNIIVHLQGPHIFYVNLRCKTVASSTPDPGSAILMCVEVLTTISRKHGLFSMDVWHVGHMLHIPAALFQNFHQHRISKASRPSDSFMVSEEQNSHSADEVNFCHVDHQFTINLFVACCQLLCTIIRHRPSECKQCVAHLEASVAVLLNCLETVLENNKSLVSEGWFMWEVEEGVKCACFLRRIYEEIKQQKDIFGRQCCLFLSNYISVYSGYGPKRSGIRREVDEALRPGVYALIDACSVDDLQYLHTFFGEGPCRSTLATLQHDYRLNFKYEGKV
ncbi:unnamed protein product [Vicia faba]|uniref:Nucleolar 27S pre-rRNA processing Urb2/Npa2 C-terminal domain-containing protein n=1 Tax=Vicia faba TaxID=3906 RepID=A0AAV1B772_VICFA|nr:unnamed protein product [Vicia faba]